MQRRREHGQSGIEVVRKGGLSGPGVSDAYMTEVQTPANLLQFASGLRELGQTDTCWKTNYVQTVRSGRNADFLTVGVGDALILNVHCFLFYFLAGSASMVHKLQVEPVHHTSSSRHLFQRTQLLPSRQCQWPSLPRLPATAHFQVVDRIRSVGQRHFHFHYRGTDFLTEHKSARIQCCRISTT